MKEIAELLPENEADPLEVLAVTGGVPFWVAQWAIGGAGEREGDRLGLIRRRLEALPGACEAAALEGAAVLGEREPFGSVGPTS